MSNYRRSRAQGAAFFFTVTLANRSSTLLIDEIDRLCKAYAHVQDRYTFETVAICVLPDHLHALWQLPEGDANYALRWQLIKRNFSSGLEAADRTPSKLRKREKGIWQRRYWEHQIRDEADLAQHVNYIHYNPVKHGLVTQVKDWPYSSFARYAARGDLPADWAGVDTQTGEFGE
jgi:putative transposase